MLVGLTVLGLIATTLSLIGAPPQAEAQPAPTVALIVRTVPIPNPGSDVGYFEHLTERGWDVTLVDDDRIRDEGASVVSGFDLVVISSSIYARRIDQRLRDIPEPVIVAEPQLFRRFAFTAPTWSASGLTSTSRKVAIVDENSPLVAGLSAAAMVDEPFVSRTAKPMNYAEVAGDAHVAAVAKDNPDQAVLFSYDVGDEMASGKTAKGRRVGIFTSQLMPALLNGDGWALFDSAAAWASPAAPPPLDREDFDPIAPTSGAHFGANVSSRSDANPRGEVLALEAALGRQLSIVHRYHEFSAGLTSSFYWDRQNIAAGHIPMISWRATDNGGAVSGGPDPERAVRIVNGEFDVEIEAMAVGLRDLDSPVLVRFNWEMDQELGKNQHIGTPSEFIAAWRYVHDMFDDLGANNVEWIWAPRAASFNKDIGPTFYPGDGYVDWVGGSAVPIDSFRDPETIFGAWNDWASSRAQPKPQLMWVGLRENPNSAAWKPNFVDDLRTLISGPWSNVKAMMYYHSQSPLGYPYWMDTTARSLREFQEILCDPHFETTFSC